MRISINVRLCYTLFALWPHLLCCSCLAYDQFKETQSIHSFHSLKFATDTEDLRKIPNISFTDEADNTYTIKNFEGQIVILYFWASWCIECLNELQRLDALKAKLLYENVADIEIIPLSIDFKTVQFVYDLYQKSNITNLALFLDKTKNIIKILKVDNIPTSIILDKNLREIARSNNHIKWNTESATTSLIQLRGGPVEKFHSNAKLSPNNKKSYDKINDCVIPELSSE